MKKINSIQDQWLTGPLHFMTIKRGVAVATITLLPLNVAMAAITINGSEDHYTVTGSDYTVTGDLSSNNTRIIDVTNGSGDGSITVNSGVEVKTTGKSNPIVIDKTEDYTGELGTLTNRLLDVLSGFAILSFPRKSSIMEQ